MSGFKLGTRSRSRLVGVHPILVQIVERAIELTTHDFTVLEGRRTKERQKELVAQGVSWTMNSRHLTGHAVDLAPVPIDWTNLPAFDAVAKAMFAAADEIGVTLRWGADWDRDGTPRERGESDSPHFELSRNQYP